MGPMTTPFQIIYADENANFEALNYQQHSSGRFRRKMCGLWCVAVLMCYFFVRFWSRGSTYQMISSEDDREYCVHTAEDCPSHWFCNYDNGHSGFCEECSNYDTPMDCHFDGLPVKGIMDCKKVCFHLGFVYDDK